mmetsp:Transcript_29294/g.113575  ORF Transcript_29294/g.113575 Transcript_29294/m.113575 type:complete len:100 (-) Transcript_29294:61-360(-)
MVRACSGGWQIDYWSESHVEQAHSCTGDGGRFVLGTDPGPSPIKPAKVHDMETSMKIVELIKRRTIADMSIFERGLPHEARRSSSRTQPWIYKEPGLDS